MLGMNSNPPRRCFGKSQRHAGAGQSQHHVRFPQAAQRSSQKQQRHQQRQRPKPWRSKVLELSQPNLGTLKLPNTAIPAPACADWRQVGEASNGNLPGARHTPCAWGLTRPAMHFLFRKDSASKQAQHTWKLTDGKLTWQRRVELIPAASPAGRVHVFPSCPRGCFFLFVPEMTPGAHPPSLA